jgi:ATP-binding cassette subfamily B protein
MLTLLRLLFRNLKGYRYLVVIAVVMALTQVGADLLTAFPFKFIADKIQKGTNPPAFLNGPLSLFDLLGSGIERVTPPQHSLVGVILLAAVLLIFFGLVSAVLSYYQLYIAAFLAQHLSEQLRKQLFEQLQRLSLDWHGQQKKGDLVQRITADIGNIEKLVTDGMVDLFAGSLTLVGVILVMLVLNARFTVLALAVAPALAVVVFSYTTAIKAAARKTAQTAAQVANVAAEDIGAITVIKAFTREEREALRFTRYVGSNREAGMRAGSLQAQFTPIVTILVAIGTAIIIGVGAFIAGGHDFSVWSFTIPKSSLSIGDLTVFLVYLKLLYQPMRDLSKLTTVATNATAGAERIQEVLDQAPEVLESAVPYYGPRKLKGDIKYEHVFFSYAKDRPVLKGIDLHIQAGKKVALVGLSGGGKTTLVKLIPRFYEVQQGCVKIDDLDNRKYPLALLRQNVSMVLQDSVLFEGTIRDNIEIGRPGASDAEIIDAAKKAQIHETIMNLPEGYNTKVREQGKNFSGGQRQRLAIARAVLRDAPILILDEPTASLDVEAEAEVMRALDTLIVGRTVLMISHRLNTLGNVDEIIVLKDGQIVEQGSFKVLKHKGGVFAHLLQEQDRYNAERAGDKSIIRSAFARPVVQEQRQVLSASPPFAPVPIPQPPSRGGAPVPGAANNGVQQPMRNMPQRVVSTRIAHLLVEVDGKIIGEYHLNPEKPVLTVGRSPINDVQVPSPRVSRFHARLHWETGTWVLEDAESLNGLLYQGKRITRLPLTNGVHIHMAPAAVLRYKES